MDDKNFIKEEKKRRKLNKRNEKAEQERIKEIEKDTHQAILNDPNTKEGKKRLEIIEKNSPPKRSVLEEIGNSVTHGVGAILAIVGIVFMLLRSDTPLKVTAAIVYGFCMFFMMLMSCLYHAFKSGSKVKRLWRRFDYSSIYLLIGGTFAPLLLIEWMRMYNNIGGYIIFGIQWAIIITGITLVAVFGPGRMKKLNFPLYFSIGWSGVVFIPGFINSNINLFWMILAGGLVYTIGMIPFVIKAKGSHFIWHFFVLVGAIVQYLGILFFVF